MSHLMRKFLGMALWWLHFFLVLFVILTPFVQKSHLLLADLVLIPLIKLHWMINSNRCLLTTISDDLLSDFRPKSESGFIGDLGEKIFKIAIPSQKLDQITHWVMLGLWFICVYNYGSRIYF